MSKLALLLPLALLTCFLCTGVRAQILDPSDDGRPRQGDPDFDATERRAGPQDQRETLPDTFGIFLYRAENPNAETEWADSLLDGVQRYEPDRKVDYDYGHLGQRGSAAYRLLYQPEHRRGTEIGLRQFDLYQLTSDNLDFYRLERPYTNLGYVRESEQNDSWTHAEFSRNFADGVNLLLNYTRIAQLGTQDQYPNQSLRNTHVATGLAVRPPGSRYSGFFSFAANTYEQLQNGGVIRSSFDDLEDGGEVDNLQNLDTYINESRLRYSFREVNATQYLQFGGRTDTLTGRSRRAFTLGHRLRYNANRYRVSTFDGTTDTIPFFERFPELIVDRRGTRSQIEHTRLENDLTISTFRRTRTRNSATVQQDVLELGLTHVYHRIKQTADSTINNVIAHGRIGLRPNDRLNLVVDGQLNLVGQTGDYRVAGRGTLDLGEAGKLELAALNQLYAPDLIQQTLWLNGAEFYRNDFAKTLEVRLEGAYTLPVVKIRTGVAYSLLTDYIYYDRAGLPRQNSGVTSILQLSAERKLNAGKWTFDNRVFLQTTDRDVIRLPELYGEHSFYRRGKWFGVLNVQLGVDVRYAGGFQPNYYNTVTQQFQLQEEQTTSFAYQIDPFFGMRVTRFRFFVKYVNLQSQWDADLLYLSADHPYPDAAVRFGVTWRMLD